MQYPFMFHLHIKNINASINEYIGCGDMTVQNLKDMIAKRIGSYGILVILIANGVQMNDEDMISTTVKPNTDTTVNIMMKLNPKKVVIDKLSEWLTYFDYEKSLIDKDHDDDELEDTGIKLEHIPEYIGILDDLEGLYCYGIGIKTLPISINKLTKLQHLILTGNKICKIKVNNFSNLTFLELGGNLLTDFPDIWNLTKLEIVGLGRNDISGPIPIEIGKLKNLKKIYLENNKISGNIPEEIYSLTKLEVLSLAENELTGEISPKIGNLQNLYNGIFNDNKLTGKLPSEIGSLTKIIYLSVFNNNFSEDIPIEIKQTKNYKTIMKVHKSFLINDANW